MFFATPPGTDVIMLSMDLRRSGIEPEGVFGVSARIAPSILLSEGGVSPSSPETDWNLSGRGNPALAVRSSNRRRVSSSNSRSAIVYSKISLSQCCCPTTTCGSSHFGDIHCSDIKTHLSALGCPTDSRWLAEDK